MGYNPRHLCTFICSSLEIRWGAGCRIFLRLVTSDVTMWILQLIHWYWIRDRPCVAPAIIQNQIAWIDNLRCRLFTRSHVDAPTLVSIRFFVDSVSDTFILTYTFFQFRLIKCSILLDIEGFLYIKYIWKSSVVIFVNSKGNITQAHVYTIR